LEFQARRNIARTAKRVTGRTAAARLAAKIVDAPSKSNCRSGKMRVAAAF
jgi:hypothetical protein